MAGGNGTNPIHNKKPKKKVVEEDEDDKAHKAKLLEAKKADAAARQQALKPGAMKMGQQGIKKGGKK